MNLDDLVGEHLLSGIAHGALGDSATISFTLDGRTFTAVQDPEDGYRSCMRSFYPEPVNSTCKVQFLSIRVLARMVPDKSSKILELIVIETGKTVLEVGTRDIDDYYPCWVGNWFPENLPVNQVDAHEVKKPQPNGRSLKL